MILSNQGNVSMTMHNVLKQIIKETIAPLFKEEGFKKKDNNIHGCSFLKVLAE